MGFNVLGLGVAIFLLLILLGALMYGKKHSAKKLRKHFDKLAEQNSLLISSVETFRSRMVGIDCRNGKVLYLRCGAFKSQSTLIDLKTIIHCSYRKLYLQTPVNSNRKEVKLIVSDVLLEFDQEDLTIVSLPFYQHSMDGYSDITSIEQKARRWEVLVQKLISTPDT